MRYSDSPDKLKEIKTRLYIAILAGFIVFSLSAIVDVLTSTFNKLDTVSKVNNKNNTTKGTESKNTSKDIEKTAPSKDILDTNPI